MKRQKEKLALGKSPYPVELFSNFVQERKDTGRIYLMNVDPNTHGPFIEDVVSN